ncbi:tRNA pseudouridine(38-40) synthase TruA [Bauldia litoralis]|uniref:tRNA pseudouridine synthase A n=2 Tax=Bauldia litoralis TaxID=665467 RepID=A0A1G6E5Q2_9HYPH|nr:tRNA pseudouridine(38-40) synthase TruA [Bauldia litoralis]SDB52777.1 tRNA pseudouridine38-40 synthase [Bauldia litoralis]
MPRYKLTIEYDGGPFVGWQRQENGRAVQQAIEEAVFGFTGETVAVKGAGRTDAGVHALGQVAHVDLTRDWAGKTIRDALNAHLRPEPVSIVSAEPVDAAFDARFSAIERHYLYRISDRRAPPALDPDRVWWVSTGLDAEAMHLAAQALVGRHDFTTFRNTQCQAKSPIRTLDRLDVSRAGGEIAIRASARSFLHSQVRSMVGTLKKVGEGRWPIRSVGEALAAQDRTRSGPVAPAHGLYLAAVDYPDADDTPANG